LELPDFDLDDNLGEDYFAPGEDLEGNLSIRQSSLVRITHRRLE